MIPTTVQHVVIETTPPEAWAVIATSAVTFLLALFVILLGLYVTGWVIYELFARPWRRNGIRVRKYNAALSKIAQDLML